jgi:alpha-amylase/alpha-mannosidase (GH57 family)
MPFLTPENHVVVVALDGENWMFLAGYPDNGREFLRALYGTLSRTEWVRTVTPAEFLASRPASRDLGPASHGILGRRPLHLARRT